MDKLRWGILSTARICRRLIPPLQASEGSALIGVASRSLERAREFAARWDIPQCWGCYDELLASSEINAVYIPLPNHLHCRWVESSLESGKHVLCEKPLGLSAAEVDRMSSAAARSGRVLVEGFQFQFHPQTTILERALRDEELGEILLIQGHFSFRMEDPANIRLRPEAGGGCLWDIGCYPVCFMQDVLGSTPAEVFAWRRLGPTGVDVAMTGQLRYDSGVIGQFDCSFETPYRVGAEIICRRGRVALPEAWRAGISGNPGIHVFLGDREKTLDVPDADPFHCEIQAVERAVLEGAEPRYNLQESRRLAHTLDALRRSAETGHPVRLDPEAV